MGPRTGQQEVAGQGGAAPTPRPPRHPEWQTNSGQPSPYFMKVIDLATMIDDECWARLAFLERDLRHHIWVPNSTRFRLYLLPVGWDQPVFEAEVDDEAEAQALFDDLKARAPDYVMEEIL